MTIYKYLLYISFSFLLLAACKDKDEEPQLFELLSSDITNINFSNPIKTDSVFNAINFDYIYNGGGVAVGDINNDSLPDLFFTGNMVSSRLYINKGDFKFEDITEQAKVGTSNWATGVSMVDINADGFIDIYVCIASKDSTKSSNLLFINNKNNTFTEKAVAYGLADNGYSTQAAFFDYDNDGDLDMYLLTNAYEAFNRNLVRPKKVDGEGLSTDKLYRNNGDETFTNVSKEAGILVEGYGLGVAVSDINKDGWADIYVANDFISNDLMWINNGDGTFKESAADYLKHQSYNGMGTDIADYNNDGLVDIVVMDMLPEENLRKKTMLPKINDERFRMDLQFGYTPQYVRNTLQLNNGNGTFSEIGQLAGIHNTDWSWSALFADYDNDGLRDLFITNGYRKDVTDLDFIVYNRDISLFGTKKANHNEYINYMDKLQGAHVHNYIYKNKGDLTFKDVSKSWGLEESTYSNGASFVDLDNDGDLDLVINNIDQEAFVYKNNSDNLKNNNFFQIQLKGKTPNSAGLGAEIILNYQNKKQYHYHSVYRGYKSTVHDVIHFGMGEVSIIDTVMIKWPDGKIQVLNSVKTNQRLALNYEDAKEAPLQENKSETVNTIFAENKANNGIEYKHVGSEFNDFNVQPLVPHKFSLNGPGIAVGDVTGNGLDDFYVGGGAGTSGKLFLQKEEGIFEEKDFAEDKPEEDMGSLFFDADNDGDQDLYIVSGGSSCPEGSKNYQDRLYFNDGEGHFSLSKESLPNITSSGSCVTAADFDKDGDLDLFVGGRIVPAKYPMPAQSYILQNNGGRFVDVTNKIAEGLQFSGLVTAALWTDFDNDNQVDLIVTGEWMPLTFYKNKSGKFTNVTASTGLNNTTGLWNSIASGDFDGDGLMDYIAGNLGLNSVYKASIEQPVKVYAKDFDQNGSMDPILTYYIQDKEHPAHPRDNLIDQINGMKGRFPKYRLYGEATIKEVLSAEELKDAYVVKSEMFESAYIKNKGNGKFSLQPLPTQAQFSPVYGIIAKDFDGDGNLDVLLAGNSYASSSQSGWYDASIGSYLKGDGKGDFYALDGHKSGFFADKDAKAMADIYVGNNQSMVLITNNNDSLQTFSYSSTSPFVYHKLEPDDVHATITLDDKTKIKEEFYYGSSYLSQSSRWLKIPEGTSSVEITNFKGEIRKVAIPQKIIKMVSN